MEICPPSQPPQSISLILFGIELSSKNKKIYKNKTRHWPYAPQDQLSQDKISKIIPNKKAEKKR
ncbi:hypothetical protein SMWW4_v1c31620 [Serratia marcescens WW4]|nr:hypothetical protein SMWW4_v1c31620 [Serratia marcescens WW4]